MQTQIDTQTTVTPVYPRAARAARRESIRSKDAVLRNTLRKSALAVAAKDPYRPDPDVIDNAVNVKHLGHPGLQRPIKAAPLEVPETDNAGTTVPKTRGIPFSLFFADPPVVVTPPETSETSETTESLPETPSETAQQLPVAHVIPETPTHQRTIVADSDRNAPQKPPGPSRVNSPTAVPFALPATSYFSQATVNRTHPPATPLVGSGMTAMNILSILTSNYSLF